MRVKIDQQKNKKKSNKEEEEVKVKTLSTHAEKFIVIKYIAYEIETS